MTDAGKSVHFLNGELVGEEALRVSVRDLGFMRGYAVFDFFITYHSQPFLLHEHIERLFTSASLIGLALPWSTEEIAGFVRTTLEAQTTEGEKAVKVIVSGGIAHSLLPETKPTIAILVDPRHYYPKECYTKGVGFVTVEHTRYTPEAKTNNYIEGVRQAQIAQKVGAIEPLYYDDLHVLEGSTSNVFAVIDGALVTPKTTILKGITRSVVLTKLSLSAKPVERDFTIEELRRAEEVFVTASNKEIMPVTTLDGVPVGTGEVGPITKEVMKQFREYAEGVQWHNT
ncbi:MAG: aminotransferase class IV [Patescibacteria group bacterium]